MTTGPCAHAEKPAPTAACATNADKQHEAANAKQMARIKVCSTPGCGTLHDRRSGRCAEHDQQYEQSRGSRQERGYDRQHDQLRRQWAPHVAAGQVDCWRCGQPITPGQLWDLGHRDDRQGYEGPEHQFCNRSAGGKAAHA